MCLVCTIEVRVRFSEVDSLKMVWHGSYVKYLEDGREAFGRKYNLEYNTIYEAGYLAPMVDLHMQYKQVATLDDVLVIETSYVATKAAKLLFDYNIYRKRDNALVLHASSIQLFTTLGGEFEVNTPDFVMEWRKRWNC